MDRNPIFVVGVPRSGTTLLQSLLSTHSMVYSLPETHFFSSILPQLQMSAQEPFGEQQLNAAMTLLCELMDFRPSDAQRIQLFARTSQGKLTGQSLFQFVLDSYKPLICEDMRVIEKTPLHLEHMFEIHAVYPGSQFIHIVRDPRNVISSLLKTSFAPTRWLFWYTQYWNYALALAHQFSKQHPQSILTIRYETLVEDTSSTLQYICEFLGMPFEGEMITGFSSQFHRNVLIDREPWKKQQFGESIHNDPEAWRQRLLPIEIWLIERFTRYYMAEYGYTPMSTPSLRDKAKILWQSFRYPHHDMRAAQMGYYLLKRSKQQEIGKSGLPLAACLVINDVSHLRNLSRVE